MSISSVSSSPNPNQAAFQQTKADFSSLSNSLQSGDLSGAQNAFSTLQSNLQGSPNASKLTSDPNYQALQTALQNGDVSGAQTAFSALQQDVKSAHKGGHHHHGQGAAPAATGDSSASGGDSASQAAALDAQILTAQTAGATATATAATAAATPGTYVNLTT